tara:strand:+ start:602 stop:877 length:276 start_codon:yes stop_codon:yes gene_type:complete
MTIVNLYGGHLTSEQVEALYHAADTIDGRIVTDYSGRGMYGDECVGVVLQDEGDLFRFAGLLDKDFVELLGTPQWDSMGLQEIAYWPRWSV